MVTTRSKVPVHHTAETLLHRARLAPGKTGAVNHVTPESAGWSDLGAQVVRLATGQSWWRKADDSEAVLVLLGGVVSVRSNRGEWSRVGRRPDVFSGMPHAVYLPRATEVEVTAVSEVVEIACGWAPTDRDHPIRYITPDEVAIEIRGGGSNTRQINGIVPPGFDCDRLVCVEVFTPSGNWSSYPPHKHDAHRVGEGGALLEADLEELYIYKMSRPSGHAVQRIYGGGTGGDDSLDASVVARDGDIVVVPYGYHPVSAAYGYDCYYLNFLAGSAQSLACTDDPDHAWVKDTWTSTDPRVPMVTHAMEPTGR